MSLADGSADELLEQYVLGTTTGRFSTMRKELSMKRRVIITTGAVRAAAKLAFEECQPDEQNLVELWTLVGNRTVPSSAIGVCVQMYLQTGKILEVLSNANTNTTAR